MNFHLSNNTTASQGTMVIHGFLRLFILTIFCTVLFANIVMAVPPANDNFANAQLLNGPSGDLVAFNNDATKEPGEPAHGDNRGGASVWFKYVAVGNGVLYLRAGSLNTAMAVYRGTSINDITQIGESDNTHFFGSSGSHSTIWLGTVTGTTYYIAVDGVYNPATGTGLMGQIGLQYEFSDTAPPHDQFDGHKEPQYLSHLTSQRSTTSTNVGATKQSGEPNHAGNVGGRSIWWTWHNGDAHESVTFSVDATSVNNPAATISSLMAIYSGSSVNSLTPITDRISSRTNRLTILAQPNTTYHIAVDGLNSGGGAEKGNFTLRWGPTKSLKSPDYDRDGRADITVYRPSTGTFYSFDSSNDAYRVINWGQNGDQPMLNDQDGDERPDHYVFRQSDQNWYLSKSSNSISVFNWGQPGDIARTLTRYNDGATTVSPVVFRPSTGTWWVYRFAPLAPFSFQWGQAGDIPITADLTGDGTDEAVVFRPSNGIWFITEPFTNQYLGAIQFGINGDIPVPADYDGDGIQDIAVYRPSTGTWWIRDRTTGGATAFAYGVPGDIPQPADYLGRGYASIAIFRPSTGSWWIYDKFFQTSNVIQFGAAGDIPMTYAGN